MDLLECVPSFPSLSTRVARASKLPGKMPKKPQKLPLYKPLNIVLREFPETKPKNKTRKNAKKRLEEKLLRMTKSDDFITMAGDGDFTVNFTITKRDGKIVRKIYLVESGMT